MTDLWVCVCVDCFGLAFEGTRLESIESNNNNKKKGFWKDARIETQYGSNQNM